jgi:hypothetical protein
MAKKTLRRKGFPSDYLTITGEFLKGEKYLS